MQFISLSILSQMPGNVNLSISGLGLSVGGGFKLEPEGVFLPIEGWVLKAAEWGNQAYEGRNQERRMTGEESGVV